MTVYTGSQASDIIEIKGFLANQLESYLNRKENQSHYHTTCTHEL